MNTLIIFFCVLLIGTVVVLFVIFGIIAPYFTSTQISKFVSRIPCTHCDDTVHGCTHLKGVRSTWVHDSTGLTKCNNGRTSAFHG